MRKILSSKILSPKILSPLISLCVCLVIFTSSAGAIADIGPIRPSDSAGTAFPEASIGVPASSDDDDGSTDAGLTDYNTPDSTDWEVQSLSGELITKETYAGKLQIILIFRANEMCSISNSTMQYLSMKKWISDERVKVVAIGMGEYGESPETVREHVEKFKADNAPNDTYIDFCYATNNTCWDIYRQYCRITGESYNSLRYVAAFVDDPDLNLRYSWCGGYCDDYYNSAVGLVGIETKDDPRADGVKWLYSISIEGECLYDYSYEILDMLNEHRVANGQAPLKMDEGLLETAMQRAAEINFYFDHMRPDRTQETAILF